MIRAATARISNVCGKVGLYDNLDWIRGDYISRCKSSEYLILTNILHSKMFDCHTGEDMVMEVNNIIGANEFVPVDDLTSLLCGVDIDIEHKSILDDYIITSTNHNGTYFKLIKRKDDCDKTKTLFLMTSNARDIKFLLGRVEMDPSTNKIHDTISKFYKKHNEAPDFYIKVEQEKSCKHNIRYALGEMLENLTINYARFNWDKQKERRFVYGDVKITLEKT